MIKQTLVLDASQIYEWQTCPLKWFYSYKQNLQLSGLSTDAMDKGTLVHALLDLYYTLRAQEPKENRWLHSAKAIQEFKLAKLYQQYGFADTMETFIVNRFTQYMARYENDDFVIPMYNGQVGVEVGFSKIIYEDDYLRFVIEGRIDLLPQLSDGRLIFCDHKSSEKANRYYKYTPQFKTYALATGYEYGMVNYFILHKEYNPGVTFYRDLIYFPPWMIAEWKTKLIRIFFDVWKKFHDDDNELRIYEVRNDSACGGAFHTNPCQFTHLCEEGNWEFKNQIKDFKYTKKPEWTPWKLTKSEV